LPPGGFRPRPGSSVRFNSRHDLVRSRRTKETDAIEMEPRVSPPPPPSLPVRRGATREDEDAILVHSEPNQPAVSRDMAI